MNRTTNWDPQHRRYWDGYGAEAMIAPAHRGLTSRAFAVPIEETLERKRMAALPKQKHIGWQGGGSEVKEEERAGKASRKEKKGIRAEQTSVQLLQVVALITLTVREGLVCE